SSSIGWVCARAAGASARLQSAAKTPMRTCVCLGMPERTPRRTRAASEGPPTIRCSLRMLDEYSVLAGLLLCLLSVPAFLGSLELGHFWIGWILGLALVGYGNRLARREQDGARPPLLARIGRELAHVVCGLLLLVMVMLPLSIGELSLSRWSANEAAAVGRLRSLTGERRSLSSDEEQRGYRFRVARGASASVVL